MPALFNNISSEIYFYNYISNFYPAGVPGNLINTLYPTAGQQHIRDWLNNYAFSSTQRALNSADTYFYFPNVTGTPTENESCSGTCNTTNNYRFKIYLNQPYNLLTTYTDGATLINTQNSGSTATVTSNSMSGPVVSNSTTSERSDLFAFCVKSPTTVVISGFDSRVTLNGRTSDYNYWSTLIVGWLHNGIYATPFTNALERYNNCFLLELRDYYLHNYTNHYDGQTPTTTGTTTLLSIGGADGLQYYPITCQSGSYTPGLFLTDYVVFENTSNTNFRPRGTIDNRVVCVGRGTFQVGQLYKVEDVFGRTGIEHWMCVCKKYPSTRTLTAWTPGKGNAYLRGGLWKPNELDFVLIRVWVEAD